MQVRRRDPIPRPFPPGEPPGKPPVRLDGLRAGAKRPAPRHFRARRHRRCAELADLGQTAPNTVAPDSSRLATWPSRPRDAGLPPTAAAIPGRPPATKSSSRTWRPLSHSRVRTTGTPSACRPMWNLECGVVTCGFAQPDVQTAGMTSCRQLSAKGVQHQLACPLRVRGFGDIGLVRDPGQRDRGTPGSEEALQVNDVMALIHAGSLPACGWSPWRRFP